MRLLVLSNKSPYPALDGSSKAMASLFEGLVRAGVEVHWLALNPVKHRVEAERADAEFRRALGVFSARARLECLCIDGRPNALGAAFQWWKRESYFTSRFHPEVYRVRVEALLRAESFDGVQLEGASLLGVIPLIRARHRGWISFRAHNIEHRIWERMAQNSRGLKQWYLQGEARKLRRWEREGAEACDALIPMSDTDKAGFRALGYAGPAQTIGFGIPVEAPEIAQPTKVRGQDPVFVGSFDWLPNLEAVDRFLAHIWPEVYRRFPERRFRILGRGAPDRFQSVPGVELIPEPADARRVFAASRVLVAPFTSGSGIRIKIIEALAEGCPVLSTPVGAEGILDHSTAFLQLAETDAAWIEQLCSTLEQPVSESVLDEARAFVSRRFDRDRLGVELRNFYRDLSAEDGRDRHLLHP